jgi:dihydrofolate synthase / folylpolyglutamate synthase
LTLDPSESTDSPDKGELVLNKLLERIPENSVRPRLEPTKRAVELLGDPQKSYRIIHITGTNGKTSTARFIERILREHGIRTGRFTSPHLLKLNERIAIDGDPVDDEVLFDVYSEIEPILDFVDQELLAAGETRLTFFEALAVLGFAIFADAPVEVVVLEVGMGGEWDSTNVADGDVAVFTPIDLDHVDRLGKTIEEIAKTKSGIIKQGAVVVSAAQPEAASNVLSLVSKQKAESLLTFGKDFSFSSGDVPDTNLGTSFSGLAGSYGPYQIPIIGNHQLENLSLAIAAVEAFLGRGSRAIPDDILRSAVSDISSPGRLQLIRGEPEVLLDGAHNPHGAKVLARTLEEKFNDMPLIGLIAVLEEKDAEAIAASLSQSFDQIIVTESTSPRAMSASELSRFFEGSYDAKMIVEPEFSKAFELAKNLAQSAAGLLVVSGSLSLVSDVLKLIQEENEAE